MKKAFLILLFLGIVIFIWADNNLIPEWVSCYDSTGTIQNQKIYYFGIGTSEVSQLDADNEALQLFGRNIETKVSGEIKSFLSEKNGKVKDESSSNIEISSDIGLKGVAITGKYFNEKKYYSIIKYKKDEYNEILLNEIKRDVERQKMLLSETKQKNRLNEEEQNEIIRKKRADEQIKNEFKVMKEAKLRDMKNRYSEFLTYTPPANVISFENGELIPTKMELNVKGGINSLSIEDLSFAYKKWLIQFSILSRFEDNNYHQQELQLKYQILPNVGKFYKLSVSFGIKHYMQELEKSNFFEANNLITPFVAANITLANLKYSYISLYLDAGKTSIGMNNYFFYSQLKDRLSFILALDCIYNEKLQNSDDALFVLHPGVKFKTTENISIIFSYEENRELNANLQIGF